MTTYFNELKRANEWLAERDNTIFLGQAVRFPGTGLYNSLKDIPEEKRYELPVAENMQLGMSIGLALQGFVPVSIFPRWNFLLSATDQLVNHLDKMVDLWGKHQKVIIRTAIGSTNPLHPQSQHIGDFTEVFEKMCPNILVVRLDKKEDIFQDYVDAYFSDISTILVEWPDKYNE